MRNPFTDLRPLSYAALPALLAGLLPGCFSDEPDDEAASEVAAAAPAEATSSAALVGGTATTLRPEIGQLAINGLGCTGTLVTTRLVLTAGHCVRYTNANVAGSFTITLAGGGTATYGVDRTFALGIGDPNDLRIGLGASDVAVVRLSSEVSSAHATPTYIWPSWASAGTAQTIFGYGCQNRTTKTGGGAKQFFTFTSGVTSSALCPGDSGGPVVWYGASDGGPVFAVNSGYDGFGNDMFGDASTYGLPGVEAVKRFSDAVVTNVSNSFLAAVAAQSGAKIVGGDFNGDTLTDLALVGGAGWGTVPVAFSNGDGSFTVTNYPDSFLSAVSAQAGAQVAAGDFNGDGRDDLALAGGNGWGTIPVAISNGNGTFAVTNYSNSFFSTVAAQPGAKLIAGKFNSDARADLVLVGGAGWSTIPVATSNGDGTFAVTNYSNSFFAGVSATAGAKALAGDFNADGRTDLAITGPSGWGSIPVAFSNGDGTFATTNQGVAHFPGWAAQGSKVVAGDFDGDGRADLALTGSAGWITIAFAFSTGGGNFTAGNLPINDLPGWSATSPFAVAGRFKPHTGGGDGKRDIALLGNSAWSSVPMVSLRN